MPGGDGTGPMGMGSMTGRGAGFCTGFAVPGYMNPSIGYGRWARRGRGYRRMYYFTGIPGWQRFGYPAVYDGDIAPIEDEREYLNDQLKGLEDQLQEVKKRLEMLDDEDE